MCEEDGGQVGYKDATVEESRAVGAGLEVQVKGLKVQCEIELNFGGVEP